VDALGRVALGAPGRSALVIPEAAALAAELLVLELLAPGDRQEHRKERPLAPASARRVLEFMEAHLGDAVSQVALARAAHASPFHFARQFARTFGRSPHAFLSRWRVARAVEQLRTTTLPVGDIARASGFSSRGHFARRVRAATGLTPRALRRQAAQAPDSPR
jgi:AraC family transcriptional regulator